MSNEHAPYPRHRWIYLALCALVGVTWMLTMLSISPYLETIATDLNVGPGGAANLATAFLVTAGIVCILGGAFVDRYGTMTFFILGCTSAALGAALMPLAGSNYWLVLVLRIAQGVSYGGLCTMGPTVALWFRESERGTVAGLLGILASLGAVAAMLVGPLVYKMAGGWREMSAVISIPIWALLIALILFTLKYKPNAYEVFMRQKGPAADEETGFRFVLSNAAFWLCIVLVVLMQWGHLSLNNLGPAYIAGSAGLGLGPDMAGQLSQAIMIFMGIGPLFTGAVLLRMMNRRHDIVLIILFIVGALSLYSIVHPAVTANRLVFILGMAIAAASTSSVLPMLAPFAAEIFPHNVVGRVMGLWVGIGTLSGGMTVSLSGLILTRTGSYVNVFVGAAAAAAAGVLFSYLLIRARNKKVNATAEAYMSVEV